ncbi:MAG: XRE family transcriptional regulator [uncultured Clostridium sp.]
MFKNLRAEMARANITNKTLADALNLNPSTMSAKLNEINRLKYAEAKKIQSTFFPNLSTDYLFEFEESSKQ